MHDAFIIKRPLVTEKATDMASQSKYVFMVRTKASKPEIKKAVKDIYKVEVIAVNVINRPPKRKRFGGAMKGVQEGYRKAVVTLKAGQKIDVQ